jgi:thioredoxin-dependent peroxiredoxin
MSNVYVIETSAGLAGIAIRFASGLRFGAADDLYGPLEHERWQRIEDLWAAVDQLAAPGDRAHIVVESWPLTPAGSADAISEEINAMTVRLGDVAPDFVQDSTDGPIRFHDWIGDNWVVLFSHPRDFTPVCTTELGAVAKLKSEFDRRNVKVIALSVDPLAYHREWVKDVEETQGARLNFPLLADADRKVATLYDMIHPNASDTLTVRSVYVIGPDKRVKLTLTYPASTGRNFDELLRVIDSLQLTSVHKVATPVDWRDGDDCIILPTVSDAEANAAFPKGYRTIKPYLRFTPQPGRP